MGKYSGADYVRVFLFAGRGGGEVFSGKVIAMNCLSG